MAATSKPFNIEKKQVLEAFKAVKSNGGAAGVDGQTLEQFEADLKNNLYKIWNRMSSGTAWAMRKFKRFRDHKTRAGRFFVRLSKERADLFAHWQIGMIGVFA
jgi:retron-type reverse transcriptase